MTSPASNGQQRPSQPQPTVANAGSNGPLEPHMRPCATCRHHCLMGERPPEQVHILFQRLSGCMALKTLKCCGNASLPEQRSALMDIHHLTPPKIKTACLGGCPPSVRCTVVGLEASFGALEPFPPALAMVVMVVVCVL